MHHLHRLSVAELVRGAPDLVATDDFAKGLTKRVGIERSVLPNADGLVIYRISRGELAEVPECS